MLGLGVWLETTVLKCALRYAGTANLLDEVWRFLRKVLGYVQQEV